MPETILIEFLNAMQEKIVAATVQHFGINEATLTKGTSYRVAYMRWCCFYLVKENTQLTIEVIGKRLCKTRTPVYNGIETISVHRKIYGQTKDDIRKIAEIAGISPG